MNIRVIRVIHGSSGLLGVLKLPIEALNVGILVLLGLLRLL